MGNRCIRPSEKQNGETRTSLDWDDEVSFHSMCARNSRHNSGLGKSKSTVSTGKNNQDDPIQSVRSQGSIRIPANGRVRQRISNISFADEIQQIFLYSEHTDGNVDSPAKQKHPLQPTQVKPVLAQCSKPLAINPTSKIQIAA